jgi:outer membrane immunogenic protein
MNVERLLVSTALATIALSTSASAQEFGLGDSALHASRFGWSGVYVGVNAGGSFGNFEHLYEFTIAGVPNPLLDGSIDLPVDGLLGGAQAGYNWQSGHFVYGVETDFQGSTVEGKGSISGGTVAPGGAVLTGQASTKLDRLGTVRARVGYTPVDRFMVYATGGFAYGHTESVLAGHINSLPIASIKSETKTGWVVGGGVEYALKDNWTIKSEYLYTNLGTATLFSGDLGIPGFDLSFRNDIAFHAARVGLNYKF